MSLKDSTVAKLLLKRTSITSVNHADLAEFEVKQQALDLSSHRADLLPARISPYSKRQRYDSEPANHKNVKSEISAWSRLQQQRSICRLMPQRVTGNATPMLRTILGKKRAVTVGIVPMTSNIKHAIVTPKVNNTQTEETATQTDISSKPHAQYLQKESSTQTHSLHCIFCHITFADEVIFSLHMGCHSHRNPFICNVCGQPNSDRYSFYTHIMRGHTCI